MYKLDLLFFSCLQLIVEEMNKLIAEDKTVPAPMNSVLIDHFMWDFRRDHDREMKAIPFHKVRCIYY
jgi:hypothetical protein